MAIATLDTLYGNPKVFSGVVQICKGMLCQLILQTVFGNAVSIAKKATANKRSGVVNSSFDRTTKACDAWNISKILPTVFSRVSRW